MRSHPRLWLYIIVAVSFLLKLRPTLSHDIPFLSIISHFIIVISCSHPLSLYYTISLTCQPSEHARSINTYPIIQSLNIQTFSNAILYRVPLSLTFSSTYARVAESTPCLSARHLLYLFCPRQSHKRDSFALHIVHILSIAIVKKVTSNQCL